jgi:hypothetical protein
MKRFIVTLIASTALTGFGATAAYADPDIVAGISVGPGTIEYESGFSENTFTFSGMTSIEYNFTPNLGVQGDLVFRKVHVEDDYSYEYQVSTIDGALHGFYRDPDNFLLGGFVQIGKSSDDHGAWEFVVARQLAGIEGQVFLDQLTLYGQVGLQHLDFESWSEEQNGWFATAEARYFITEDLKVSAHVGLSQTRWIGYDTGHNTVNFGIGAEYKITDMPISVFGAYDFTSTTDTYFPYTIDSHRLTVGLKFNLGEDTLQARDRNGVSLKPVEFHGVGYGWGGGEL